MRRFRAATSSTAGLISILLTYLLLIILILVFARQIISDASLESPISGFIVIPLVSILPVLLLIAIGLNVLRVIREKRRGKVGAQLKIRFMLFFTFITLLSAIPQGILSVSFIEIAMRAWFSAPVAEGLEDGVALVLQYHQEKVDALKVFGSSPMLDDVLKDVERSPEAVWNIISKTSTLVNSIEIFNAEGAQYGFFGDERGRMRVERLEKNKEGLLQGVSYTDYSALRYLRKHRVGNQEYFVIMSTIILKDFGKMAERLTDSNDTFHQIDLFLPTFRIVLIVFYSVFSVPLILLSLLVSFLISEEVIQPILNLEEATRRVADGDFSYRILDRSGNELAALVRSFNDMVSELELSRAKLLQSEKISAWKEIAQRMAHEIKNPLTPIKLSAQRILHKHRQGKGDLDRILEPAIQSIITEVENLNNLLLEFRDFARLPAPEMVSTNLHSLIEEVLAMYSGFHPAVQVEFDDFDPDIAVQVDRNQMKRVFSNLIKNAFEAIEDRGTVSIRSNLVRKGNKQYCRIQIKDTGTGIDPSLRNKVFNPYLTTKDGGTGLGLPIVERIIFDHEGQIWFETEQNIGTTFYIDLPLGDL